MIKMYIQQDWKKKEIICINQETKVSRHIKTPGYVKLNQDIKSVNSPIIQLIVKRTHSAEKYL